MLKQSPEIKTWLSESYLSTKMTATDLFPDNFYSPFNSLHDRIFDWIDRKTFVNKKCVLVPSNKKVCAAPRGIGKTTIVRTVAGKAILWRDVNFITYTSNSADVAVMQTENLKADLKSPRIREFFGSVEISDYIGDDKTFGKKAWIAFGNTMILPRGFEQQHRGLNWRGHRPQLLILDDLEDKDLIQSEQNRKKLKERFFSDIEKCINRFRKDYTFIYIDTLKHEDSLLALLLESSDWDGLNLSICDENYKSLAPEYMTDEEIAHEVDIHRENGVLDEFYREYMNIPISTEDAVFMAKYFQYYSEVDEDLDHNPRIENVVIVDPAKTVKLHSADSAVIGIGFDRLNSKIYIRDLVAKKMHPDELYNVTFDMIRRLKAKVLAVEVTGLNEFVTYPYKNEISSRKVNVEFVELNPRSKKEDRIAQMAPFYRKGQVFHNKLVTGPLEAQLLSFPRSKRWDCMDAEAYFIELLEIAERYFYNDEDEEPSDEFDYPKDHEPAFVGWRRI